MKNFKIIISWMIVIILMVTIFCFSNQESFVSSETSTSLSKIVFDFFNLDKIFVFDNFHVLIRKIAHFSIYFVLGLATYNALFITFKKQYIDNLAITILIVMVYACSDEIHQLFVAGRSCEFRDVIIDTTGGSIGGMLYYFYLKIGSVMHGLSKK